MSYSIQPRPTIEHRRDQGESTTRNGGRKTGAMGDTMSLQIRNRRLRTGLG
jgi:hypothetical protein